MKKTPIASVRIICACVMLFGFFVWPTPYERRVIELRYGSRTAVVVVYHINRLTGACTVIASPEVNSRGRAMIYEWQKGSTPIEELPKEKQQSQSSKTPGSLQHLPL